MALLQFILRKSNHITKYMRSIYFYIDTDMSEIINNKYFTHIYYLLLVKCDKSQLILTDTIFKIY